MSLPAPAPIPPPPTEVFEPSRDLYQRIKDAVVSEIMGLNLGAANGIGTKVYSQLDVDSSNLNYPCISVITAGLTERLLPGNREDRGYDWPVGVMLLDDPGAKVHQNESMYVQWRKQIADTFHQKRLEVDGVAGGKVTGRVIFDPRLPQYAAVRSSLLLRFESYEYRATPVMQPPSPTLMSGPSLDLYSRIKDSVVQALIALNLPGIASRVYPLIVEDTSNIDFPCISVVTAGENDDLLPGNSEDREYGWPVGVLLLDNPGARIHDREPLYLGWRKQICDAFHQRRLPVYGLAGSMVDPRGIFTPRPSA